MFQSNVARAGGACIASLTILLLACSVSADTRPNVILVMADDMGWAQTGYYGYPLMKTPNLDDMARNGLRMDRFYAGAPSCPLACLLRALSSTGIQWRRSNVNSSR